MDQLVCTPLWSHQREDVAKLRDQLNVLIANSMGTGKTLLAIERDLFLRKDGHTKDRPTVVITPLATHIGWRDAFEQETGVTARIIDRKNRNAFLKTPADVYIMHYEALRLMPELQKFKIGHLIADECHHLKTRSAQQTKAARKLRPLCLTLMSGSPVTDRPQDLWQLLNLINRSKYSSYWGFFEEFVNYQKKIIKKELPNGKIKLIEYKEVLGPSDRWPKVGLPAIRPFFVRRRQEECIDIPPKLHNKLYVDLSPTQRRVYNEMRDNMLAWIKNEFDEDEPLPAPAVIAKLIRLQQITAGTPEFGPPDKKGNPTIRLVDPSSKVDGVMELLGDHEEHQFVIFCADDRTEALTRDGWKRHNDLADEELILTYNKSTRMCEWQPAITINRFNGTFKMKSVETRNHSSLTTLEHRWLAKHRRTCNWRWKTTDEISENWQIPCAAPCADVPTEPKYTDSFVELVAWFCAEGTQNNSGGISISQSELTNSVYCDMIRSALEKFAPKRWNVYIKSDGVCDFHLRKAPAQEILKIVECKRYSDGRDIGKIASFDFILNLTRSQLQFFVDTWVRADGYIGSTSTSITQKRKEVLEPVQLACQLLGIRTSLYLQANHKPNIVWRLSLLERKTFRFRDPKDVIYTGTVWCPTTENSTWVARRDGHVYITGNSQFKGPLRILRSRFERQRITYGSFTGDDDQRVREINKRGFIDGSRRILLSTISTGGVGVDGLQRACNNVIFIDREWSPPINDQAIARLWRAGQTKPVNVFDFIANDTVDFDKLRTVDLKAGWVRKMLGDE